MASCLLPGQSMGWGLCRLKSAVLLLKRVSALSSSSSCIFRARFILPKALAELRLSLKEQPDEKAAILQLKHSQC